MNAFRFLAATAATVALAGCHGGVETDVMERELRQQEDQIYHLLDQVDETRAELETTQKENQQLKAKLTGGGGSALTPPGDFSGALPELEPPQVEPGTPTEPGALGPTPTELNQPEPDPPADVLPAESSSTEPDLPEPGPPADPLPAESSSTEPSAGLRGSQTGIDRLVVQPLVGAEAGQQAGANRTAIRALVEPRAADGSGVRYRGPISLMLVDKSHRPRPARVGRWDFSAAQAASRWQRTGTGAVFELPWPEGALPANSQLQLWARIVLPEGRKLLAHADLDVAAAPLARPPQAVAQAGSDDGFHARRPAARNRPAGWVRRAAATPPSSAPFGPTRAAAEPSPLRPRQRPIWRPDRATP